MQAYNLNKTHEKEKLLQTWAGEIKSLRATRVLATYFLGEVGNIVREFSDKWVEGRYMSRWKMIASEAPRLHATQGQNIGSTKHSGNCTRITRHSRLEALRFANAANANPSGFRFTSKIQSPPWSIII